jgi:hypothetical protein
METKEQNINKQIDKKQNQKSQTQPQSENQNQTARVYNAGELSNTGTTDLRDSNTDRVTATDRGKLPNEKQPTLNENEVVVPEEEKIYAAGNKPGQVNKIEDLDDEENEYEEKDVE